MNKIIRLQVTLDLPHVKNVSISQTALSQFTYTRMKFLKANLHGTTLSHTTSLQQAYDMTWDLHDSRKWVVGLIYKTQFMS